MKMLAVACTLAVALLGGCAIQREARQPTSSQKEVSDRLIQVTTCQLLETPWRYDHRLIEVSADVSFGFEEFNLWPGDCTAQLKSAGIWLDYGGVTMTHSPPHPLVIEGIPCYLKKDAAFIAFDELIHRRDSAAVRATLIGRFFAGQPMPTPSRLWGGYGQMGGYSLLVITQVLSSLQLNTKLPPHPE